MSPGAKWHCVLGRVVGWMKPIARSLREILPAWICLAAYLWALEFQSVYRADFTPFLDGLADCVSILWTLLVWATAVCALIALSTLGRAPAAVRRASDFICRVGCILVSGFFLKRWLDGWLPAEPERIVICWILLIVFTPLYFWVRQRRRGAASAAPDSLIPTWRDSYHYVTLPMIIVISAAVGVKIAASTYLNQKRAANAGVARVEGGGEVRNVIVIISDSLRAQSISAYAQRGHATPFLDGFANASSVYMSTHSNSTTTAPSLLSLLAGRSPITHGRLNRDLPPPTGVRNIFQILREHGYTTAAVTSNSDAAIVTLGLAGVLAVPEVMNFQLSPFSWLRDWGVYPTPIGERMYRDLAAWLPFLGFPRRTSIYGDVDDTLDRAWDLIARLPHPFFLVIHIHEPHGPHALSATFKSIQIPSAELVNAPRLEFYAHYAAVFQPLVDAYRVAYEASVRRVDAGLEKLFADLKQNAWFDNSLIIFTADHGESFERGYFYHGEELYENSTRVPLMIRFPRQREGKRIVGFTQTLDIAPTILQVLNVAVPAWMEGQPLAQNTPPEKRATVATNYRRPDGKASYPLPTKLAVWWEPYKLILTCAGGTTELYDLKNDPQEQSNLAETHQIVVDEMKHQLRSLLAKQSHEPRLLCPNI